MTKYVFPHALTDPQPTPIHIADRVFTCKWCGGERRVLDGVFAAHTCAVVHTVNEDLDFLLEEARKV